MVQRNTGLAGRTKEEETAVEASPPRERYRALEVTVSNLAIACKVPIFFIFLEVRAALLIEARMISDKDGIVARGRTSRALRGHCAAPQEQSATLQFLQNASFSRPLKNDQTFHKIDAVCSFTMS